MNIDELIEKGYVERLIMKTPKGGDYSEAHFFGSNGEYTTKDKATRMVIKEYKQDGTFLFETFMNKKVPVSETSKLSIDPKMKDIINNAVETVDVSLALTKGLYTNSELNDTYYLLYRNYQILLDRYLLKKLSLNKLDDKITNSKLKFIPIDSENMDVYQSISSMNLKYIYLRNKLNVEKLSLEEIKKLISLSAEELNNPSEEVFKLIETTFKRVIDSNRDESKGNVLVSYGINIKDYWIDSCDLVFSIRHDEFADNGLGQEDEWEDNYFNQNIFLINLMKENEKIYSEKLGINVHFLRFDQFTVKKNRMR